MESVEYDLISREAGNVPEELVRIVLVILMCLKKFEYKFVGLLAFHEQ